MTTVSPALSPSEDKGPSEPPRLLTKGKVVQALLFPETWPPPPFSSCVGIRHPKQNQQIRAVHEIRAP